MNTKKSKFQERLDTIAKQKLKDYDPEEDRGSMNDQVKLHMMDVNEDDIKLFSLRDMDAIILLIEEKLIPNIEMPQTGNDAHLGYNTAIRECLTLLNRVTRETKVKLHNTQTGT